MPSIERLSEENLRIVPSIDIIQVSLDHSEDNQFICPSLSPAKDIEVLMTEETQRTKQAEDGKHVQAYKRIEVDTSLDSLDSNEEKHVVSIHESLAQRLLHKYLRKFI
jgi:hypothetical protein